ncbi:MAG: hypothetical protein ACHQ6U_12180, partial [Thermodesulfobacteriota bacterium]
MSSIWDTILEKEPHIFEEQIGLEHIPQITLSEFSKRDMAVEIYSEVLQQTVWLCSNSDMVLQIEEDNPG